MVQTFFIREKNEEREVGGGGSGGGGERGHTPMQTFNQAKTGN